MCIKPVELVSNSEAKIETSTILLTVNAKSDPSTYLAVSMLLDLNYSET